MMMEYITQQVHETESSVQKDTKLLHLKPHKFTVVQQPQETQVTGSVKECGDAVGPVLIYFTDNIT
jgi:hypothetical protein